ncbi:MAG TPA: tetraacyldisaccharide 4'-kinase [Elusimicrobiota bacterium]|nr:tetraacyldisaccharide 4'-kinase [Elusimicrobiota bacterium]
MNWEHRRRKIKKNKLGFAWLWILSLLYGAVVLLRRRLYRLGALRAKSLPAKVICIGNLTAGGAGKTPTVLLAAQTLADRGIPVSILSRGYGRRGRVNDVLTLLDDNPPPWTACGDEPWMMHHTLLGLNIPILVCANRFKSGAEAVHFYHSKVLVLDDGFQHMKLKRDLDIVLLNAADPFGGGRGRKGRMLPLGNLREPVSGLARAGLVLLTHVDRADKEELKALRERVAELNPEAPIVESVHEADFFLDLKTQKKYKPSHIQGEHVVALSAIADPEQFEETLVGLGARIAQKWRYPDHHPYTLSEVRAVESLRGDYPVVTTLKDMTRLPDGWQEATQGQFLALAIRLNIVKGRQAWTEKLAAVSQLARLAPIG